MQIPEWQILPFCTQDAKGIAALEKICFSAPWSAQMILESAKNGHLFFVAKRDGQICGYCGLQIVLDEGYLTNLAVSPEMRRKGLGRALLCRLDEVAIERGLSFLTLEVRASNAVAKALYASAGFCPVGRRPGFYSAPKEDAILMTKEFKHENSGH